MIGYWSKFSIISRSNCQRVLGEFQTLGNIKLTGEPLTVETKHALVCRVAGVQDLT